MQTKMSIEKGEIKYWHMYKKSLVPTSCKIVLEGYTVSPIENLLCLYQCSEYLSFYTFMTLFLLDLLHQPKG